MNAIFVHGFIALIVQNRTVADSEYIKSPHGIRVVARSYGLASKNYITRWVDEFLQDGSITVEELVTAGKKSERNTGAKPHPYEVNKLSARERLLEQENLRLRAELDLFKKVGGNRKAGFKKIQLFQAILELTSIYALSLLCGVAHVSRSGYYGWLKQSELQNRKRKELLETIRFEHSRLHAILGYRRMTLLLRHKYQQTVGMKQVYQLMREHHLQAVIRRKKAHHRALYKPKRIIVENRPPTSCQPVRPLHCR